MSFIEDFANAKVRYESMYGPGSFMAKRVHRQHWVEQETARRLARIRNAGMPLWRRIFGRLGLRAIVP